MKYIIGVFVIACSICSCKNDNSSKMKTEDEIYSGIEKRIDSFVNEAVPTFSITRIKKMAKRIDEIGLSAELILDTLQDNTKVEFKKINGNFEFYRRNQVAVTKLYFAKEISRADAVAIELFDAMKRRECERWREICNNPQFPLSHEDKLLCKLYINFYCK